MKHEFAQIDGLINIFDNEFDLLTGKVKDELINEVDYETVIFVTCGSQDAEIFGEQFTFGSNWIITHGTIFGDMGSFSELTGYTRGEDSTDLSQYDTIQEAFSKLENKIFNLNTVTSTTNGDDWLIIR